MECAISGCRGPSSSVPLQVDLPYVGSFEVPLCPMHVSEFDGGCAVLAEELDEAQQWWVDDRDLRNEAAK